MSAQAPDPPQPGRRDFLKTVAMASAAGALGAAALTHGAPADPATALANAPAGKLPRRAYGRQGVQLSIVGMGGIVVKDAPQEHANATVARAVELGVNYFDVAPSYGDAEQRLGPALAPFRKDCFLACKTDSRDAQGAKTELARSLERLQTDYFDLYQLHAIHDVKKDVDAAFAPGGVMELLIARKKAGQLRHLGFSAHSLEAALAAMDRYDFDSVLLPVNFASWYQGHFGPTVMAKAQEKGMSVLALKGLARQTWPGQAPERQQFSKCWYQPLTDPWEQELALRFTLSQGVVAALPPGEESLFWRAVELGSGFRPITDAESGQLQALATTLQPVFHT
jgi:aryl-alcohol dehydrogenase-like predicted oxidoreductase